MNKTRKAIGAVSLATLLLLTGCGSDSGSDSDSETATDTQSDPGRGPGAGIDADQLEEIRACLEAAGLDDKLSTDLPAGIPSDLPSDFPTDGLPSDFPTDGLPSGAPGGGLGGLQDPEVQAALEACGIELPQAPDVETS